MGRSNELPRVAIWGRPSFDEMRIDPTTTMRLAEVLSARIGVKGGSFYQRYGQPGSKQLRYLPSKLCLPRGTSWWFVPDAVGAGLSLSSCCLYPPFCSVAPSGACFITQHLDGTITQNCPSDIARPIACRGAGAGRASTPDVHMEECCRILQ